MVEIEEKDIEIEKIDDNIGGYSISIGNRFKKEKAEQLKQQILQNEKIRKLIEYDIKRCREELQCDENEKIASHLEYVLERSKNAQ